MTIKEKLVNRLLNIIDEKILTAKAEIESAREAQQNETKSSAGDKYETSREMMTQEIEKHSKSLKDAEQQRSILTRVVTMKPSPQIKLGSLIETNFGYYFLAVGMGNIDVDGISAQTISIQSPIGKVVLTKKQGDRFEFNGKQFTILSTQ